MMTSPGGAATHFWLAVTHMSTPHASTGTEYPPMLETPSTTMKAPFSWAAFASSWM